jgi:hypothetical protein
MLEILSRNSDRNDSCSNGKRKKERERERKREREREKEKERCEWKLLLFVNPFLSPLLVLLFLSLLCFPAKRFLQY